METQGGPTHLTRRGGTGGEARKNWIVASLEPP